MLVAVVEAKEKVEVDAVKVALPLICKGVLPAPLMVQVLVPASSIWFDAIVVVEFTVTPPVPVVVVVATPLPSPKVKLLKVQFWPPPKLPVPSSKKVPPVKLIVPAPVASPPLTVMLPVPESVPVETVKSPLTKRAEELLHPPPTPSKIRLLNAELPSKVPFNVLPAAVASKVTAPLELVKVP